MDEESREEQLRRISAEAANTPNAGRKLNLDQDRFVPEELRMAHRLLKENDLTPSWILDARELDQLRERLIQKAKAALSHGPLSEKLAADIAAFNKRVLTFNLTVPQGVEHRWMIDVARLARQL